MSLLVKHSVAQLSSPYSYVTISEESVASKESEKSLLDSYAALPEHLPRLEDVLLS